MNLDADILSDRHRAMAGYTRKLTLSPEAMTERRHRCIARGRHGGGRDCAS